jgi:tetratricopeptide (TPR) repeat protein
MAFEDRALDRRARANAALRSNRWAEAENELKALLTITPKDPIAWNNLGVALEHQRKGREALEAYGQATALLPSSRLPGRNLVNGMQRYLGFGVAIILFKVFDILLHFLQLSPAQLDGATAVTVVLLALGALVYYQRRREQLPEETWRAYRSEMARTRRLRYGGLAFVFVGFLVFALLLVILVALPGGAGDGTVVLVIIGGLCWLIASRILWARVIAPRLQHRSDDRLIVE